MTIEVTDREPPTRAEEILTDDALAFLEELHVRFAARRDELLAARVERRERAAAAGRRSDFLADTKTYGTATGPSRRPRPL